MKNKFLILFLFCLSMGLARAQREPMGLLDDMLLTASQQHLPATVIHFDADDADLSDHAWRELSAAADLMAAAGCARNAAQTQATRWLKRAAIARVGNERSETFQKTCGGKDSCNG